MYVRRVRKTVPRTLIGAGGVRLYDIPGVVYPPAVLSGGLYYPCWQGEQVVRRAPIGSVSTKEAADILMCTPSSAREWLHLKKVRHIRVRQKKGGIMIYWDKKRVSELASERRPLVQDTPSTLVSTEEALVLLNVSRSTLRAYVRTGKLQQVLLRVRLSVGVRECSFYPRQDVARLSHSRSLLEKKPLAARTHLGC